MLESLFTPQTVAVVGASRTRGKVGHAILANLSDGGFQGEILPINPAGGEILGRRAFPSIRESGAHPDLSVIAVPAPAVLDVVRDSLDAGAGAIVVATAGFREVGPEGAAREREIAELCAGRGVRLLGPNCLGLINTHHHMNASFAHHMPTPGSISVISQSGALLAAILDSAAYRGVGLAKLVSIGNKADLDEIDFLLALRDDPETKVIVAYLESISAGDEFVRVAESVTSVKPVVIFKAGTSVAGVKAASSHTGSLAGADVAYGAAFRRAGVIRADSFLALMDYATALSMQPLPEGDRVAVITNAGGPGIMAADDLEHSGLKVASLDSFTATALHNSLPAAASVGNPVDVLGDADPERYKTAVCTCQESPDIDAIIVILTPQAMTQPAETARAIAECADGGKPLLAVFMGGADVMSGRQVLLDSGVPDYPSPDRAVGAIHAMNQYAAWRRRPARVLVRFSVNRRRVERIVAQHLRTGRLQVSEVKAKEILEAYDFVVPEGQLARSLEEATEVAERIGFPVVMKVVSPDVVHKSDVGGVRVNLTNRQEVEDAYDLMMLRIPQRVEGARLEGVYVEKMAPKGREVILGVSRDPQFGPMLMFGLGGIFVEVMKDVTFHLAPVTADEALQMLQGTRSYALLRGARGQRPVDLEGIARGIQKMSQLVTDFPQIEELDINPFIVGAPGVEPVAADARITLSAAGTAPRETGR